MGTIVGVGIFGLPYIASKAGFLVVLSYFLLMILVVTVTHLMFARLVAAEKNCLHLPGFVKKYFGKKWEKVSFLIFGLGITAALLAYMIIGGEFLSLFLAPYFGGGPAVYTLVFFVFAAALIYRGVRAVCNAEIAFFTIFLVILVIFLFKAAPFFNVDNLKTVDLGFLTFPYGVILFSLWGAETIPEVEEAAGGSKRIMKWAIISSILFSALIYLSFIFFVLGVSGSQTSTDAISGILAVLDGRILSFGYIFGILTCFTSFLTLGLVLKKTLWQDLSLGKNLSWFLACFLPLFLFLLGFREFLDIIGLSGALAIGFEGIMIVFLYRKFLQRKLSSKMSTLGYLLPLLFIIGMIFEFFYFFFAK